MINKVTSYSLSKQLTEAGFNSESCTGWYVVEDGTAKSFLANREQLDKFHSEVQENRYALYTIGVIEHEDVFTLHDNQSLIKAYDCFDLLMWFKENHSITLDVYTGDHYQVYKPQEALGQAVLKVLTQQEVQGE